MKSMRIRAWFALVAVLALNFVLGRAFILRDEHFHANLSGLLSVAPMGLALQGAILRLATDRGRGRVFWLGFVALGGVSISCVLAALGDPPRETGVISTSGISIDSYPGCLMARILWGYYECVYDWLDRIKYPFLYPATSIGGLITQSVAGFLPQVLLAATGGSLTTGSVGLLRKIRGDHPRP